MIERDDPAYDAAEDTAPDPSGEDGTAVNLASPELGDIRTEHEPGVLQPTSASGTKWEDHAPREPELESEPPAPGGMEPNLSALWEDDVAESNHLTVVRANPGESTARDPRSSQERSAGEPVGHLVSRADETRHALFEGDNVVGRGADNDVVLNHASVSRRHAVLTWRHDHAELRDYDSANGTFVGEQRVAATPVAQGDVLGFGDLRFTFTLANPTAQPSAPAPPAEVPLRGGTMDGGQPPKRKRWVELLPLTPTVVASALIVVACLGIAIAIVVHGHNRRTPDDALFELFIVGRDAFVQKDWPRAEEKLNLLTSLAPKDHRAQRYKEAVLHEQAMLERLSRAQASMKRGDLAAAYRNARTVTSSVYSAEASAIVQAINAELDGRVAKARAALESGRLTEARQLTESVDRAQPGRADVADLREELDMPEPGATPEPRRPTPARRPSPAMRAALDAVRGGELAAAKRALANAGTPDEKAMLADLSALEDAYESGLLEYRAKRTGTAIELLRRARELEAKIGGKSPLGADIGAKLADMHYVAGIQAQMAGRYARAYEQFGKALRLEPKHVQASRSHALLERRAPELFDEAAKLEGSDPPAARERYLLVLKALPSSHALHRRAKAKLRGLD